VGVSPLLVGGAVVLGVGGIAEVSATVAGVAAQAAGAEAVASDDAAVATARHQSARQLALGANVGFVAAGVAPSPPAPASCWPARSGAIDIPINRH
jgi:hypothetical protein